MSSDDRALGDVRRTTDLLVPSRDLRTIAVSTSPKHDKALGSTWFMMRLRTLARCPVTRRRGRGSSQRGEDLARRRGGAAWGRRLRNPSSAVQHSRPSDDRAPPSAPAGHWTDGFRITWVLRAGRRVRRRQERGFRCMSARPTKDQQIETPSQRFCQRTTRLLEPICAYWSRRDCDRYTSDLYERPHVRTGADEITPASSIS